MRYIYLGLALICSSALLADCKEDCKKAEQSCTKFAASAPGYGRGNGCQQQLNRCLAACRTSSVATKKANLRQKA